VRYRRGGPHASLRTGQDRYLVYCTPDACDLPGDDDGGGGGDGDDRMLLVLKGAFAGSRCAQISDALRVCYLEYSPLRLGGDLIFKLLKRIVASQIASQRP